MLAGPPRAMYAPFRVPHVLNIRTNLGTHVIYVIETWHLCHPSGDYLVGKILFSFFCEDTDTICHMRSHMGYYTNSPSCVSVICHPLNKVSLGFIDKLALIWLWCGSDAWSHKHFWPTKLIFQPSVGPSRHQLPHMDCVGSTWLPHHHQLIHELWSFITLLIMTFYPFMSTTVATWCHISI